MEPGDDELEYQANVRDAGLLTGHRGQQANRFQSTLMEFHRCIRNISVQSQMPVRQAARLGNILNRASAVHADNLAPSGQNRFRWRPMSRFSATVRSVNIRLSSGTKPNPRVAIWCGAKEE